MDVAAVRYDRAGDAHYDVASAFIKSMRGSDVDAALYAIQSDVQNRSWETEGDMPDPSEVDTDRENGSKSDG